MNKERSLIFETLDCLTEKADDKSCSDWFMQGFDSFEGLF